jgi:hypothetical protein
MLLFLHIMRIVLPCGGTTRIHAVEIKTLRREGGKFAGYLMWQRSQGIGLTLKEF